VARVEPLDPFDAAVVRDDGRFVVSQRDEHAAGKRGVQLRGFRYVEPVVHHPIRVDCLEGTRASFRAAGTDPDEVGVHVRDRLEVAGVPDATAWPVEPLRDRIDTITRDRPPTGPSDQRIVDGSSVPG
jgi:hypothetical protein